MMVSPPSDSVIVFYDIPSKVPGCAWSSNTFKTRYVMKQRLTRFPITLTTHVGSIALNYKGIPFRTEWVEYPDIDALLKSYGLKPNPPSAFAPYTLPAIYDPRTGRAIMDSVKIVAYLDETYPDTPPLFASSTRVLQYAFQDALFTVLQLPFAYLVLHDCVGKLNPPSSVYFRKKLESIVGCRLEEVSPPGSEKRAEQWTTVEKGFGTVASWFDAAGDGRLFILGGDADGQDAHVCHADIALASFLLYARAMLGEESGEWARVQNLDNGRWKRLLNYCERWAK